MTHIIYYSYKVLLSITILSKTLSEIITKLIIHAVTDHNVTSCSD